MHFATLGEASRCSMTHTQCINSQLYKPKHYRTTPHTRDTLERGLRLSLALLLHVRYTDPQTPALTHVLRRRGVPDARPEPSQALCLHKASRCSSLEASARRPRGQSHSGYHRQRKKAGLSSEDGHICSTCEQGVDVHLEAELIRRHAAVEGPSTCWSS